MKKQTKICCGVLLCGLLLTGCGSSGNPAQDVAENFLRACKKGDKDKMLDFSTIGLTDNLRAEGRDSAAATLSRYAALDSYTLRQCDERPEITGEYLALLQDTADFRAASDSSKYGKGVPLFESLDGVYEVQYTGKYEGVREQVYDSFYVIGKDGEWAADFHCLDVMRPRLYAAEIDKCSEAAQNVATACSKALSEMKNSGMDITELEGVHTFTSRALSDAKPAAHTTVTPEELYQTMLAKIYANNQDLRDMEQFSLTVSDGWVTAAVAQNDVYHSDNGALNFIGYGTWPHPLDCDREFIPNRDNMSLELAMTLAKK